MDSGLAPENAEPGNRARQQLNELVDVWLTTESQSGIIPYIKQNSQKSELPHHYVRNTTGTMFNATFGTLYAAIGNVVLTLLEHPDVLDRLKDKTLLDTGADELLRFDGPAQGTSRFCVEKTMIGDTEIQRGDIVLTLFAAANRDPEVFPQPNDIILDRQKNQHLSFGWGPHICTGSLFGKLAIKELITCLLDSPKQLRLIETPTRRKTATVRCIDVFPVSFQ